MIIVNAIIENGGFSPESIPTNFGSHFNGTNFIFFESDEERENFINELKEDEPEILD